MTPPVFGGVIPAITTLYKKRESLPPPAGGVRPASCCVTDDAEKRKDMSKSDYYERQEARRERYIQRAAKARRNAAFAAQKAGEMAAVIPAGQPILVGHYSEKSDRRYRERIGQTMDKAIRLDDKADYYAEKAETVGRGGISSDAPDAIVLLEHKLTEREAKQARMKEINAAFRKGDAALLALGMTQAEIDKMRENMPSYFGQPFPSFSLSNNGAEIRRLKKRIETLKATALDETTRTAFDGGVIIDNAEENRLQIIFDSKPDKAVREALKGRGFHWSPNNRAWQRKRSHDATYCARLICGLAD